MGGGGVQERVEVYINGCECGVVGVGVVLWVGCAPHNHPLSANVQTLLDFFHLGGVLCMWL